MFNYNMPFKDHICNYSDLYAYYNNISKSYDDTNFFFYNENQPKDNMFTPIWQYSKFGRYKFKNYSYYNITIY